MKKITVSVEADIELIPTKEEEKLINEINEAGLGIDDDYETYDNLTDKLNKLIMKRIEKENLKDITIHDINWD